MASTTGLLQRSISIGWSEYGMSIQKPARIPRRLNQSSLRQSPHVKFLTIALCSPVPINRRQSHLLRTIKMSAHTVYGTLIPTEGQSDADNGMTPASHSKCRHILRQPE